VTLLISAGFSLLLLSEIDMHKLLASLETMRIWPLPLAVGTTFLGLSLMTLRLKILLEPLGGDFTFGKIFRAQLVGFAGNNVLPLRMGELIRIDYLARHGSVPHSSCLAVVGVERLFDLLSLGLLFLALFPIVLPISGATRFIVFGGILAAIFIGLVLVAKKPELFVRITGRAVGIFSRRAAELVAEKAGFFINGLQSLRSPKAWALVVGSSLAYWLSAVLFTRILMLAFGLSLPFYAPALVIVFVALAGLLPSAPAYVGTYHYFAVLALKTLAVPAELATSFAIVMHFTALVPFTVVALLFLYGDVFRKRGA
jgi:uncharacterized protein (TIRG00374 family)